MSKGSQLLRHSGSSGINTTHLQNVSTGTSLGGAGHRYPVVLLSSHHAAAVPVLVPKVGMDLVPETQAFQQTLVQGHFDLLGLTVQLGLQTVHIWKVGRGREVEWTEAWT